MSMRFATVLVMILCVLTGHAQHNDTDSLKGELDRAKEDTSRILILSGLSRSYRDFNTDSARVFGERALDLSRKIGYKKGEMRALTQLGMLYRTLGDYPMSLNLLFSALQLANNSPFEYDKATILNYLGGTYLSLEDYEQAKLYLQQAREVLGPSSRRSGSLRFIIDMNTEVACNNSGQRDSAKYYLDHAAAGLPYASRADDSAYYYMEYGGFVFNSGMHDSGIANLKTCIAISARTNNLRRSAFSKAILSHCFQEIHRPDSVIVYAASGLAESRLIDTKGTTVWLSQLLAWAWEKKDPIRAIYYWKVYDTANQAVKGPAQVISLQKTLAREQDRQRSVEAERLAYENRIRLYGLAGGVLALLLVAFLLYRNTRQKHRDNIVLQKTLDELKATQTQLVHAEKMASLGELTAGIAHEIQNPLNFVNNFSEVNKELVNELKQELDKGDIAASKQLADDVAQNLEKVDHHGKRAGAIVKSMLQHSRISTGQKEPTDINALADEYLKLAFHGMRAKEKDFNVALPTDFDPKAGSIPVIPQDIGRVLLNVYNNAFYAVQERKRSGEPGYAPALSVMTRKVNGKLEIRVKDNGIGMPDNVKAKIFQPFFTTKPTGQGTGLGLSLSYDIIKAHGGDIRVESKEGEGTSFSIILPYNAS